MFYISLGLVVFAYMLGSIPFGLLIGKVFYRTDIRKYGSGNIGATNAFRTLGPAAGVSVFIADLLKGLVPVLVAKLILGSSSEITPLVSVMVGLTAVVGHSYSMFLGFSGGKGMSTAAGLVIALWPVVAVMLVLTWAILTAITRYVSFASIAAAVLLPVLVAIFYPMKEYMIFSIIAGAVIVYKHRSNIARILAGKELKIGQKVKLGED